MHPNNFNSDKINNQQTLQSRNFTLTTIRPTFQLIICFVQLNKPLFHTPFTSLTKPMPQSFNQNLSSYPRYLGLEKQPVIWNKRKNNVTTN